MGGAVPLAALFVILPRPFSSFRLMFLSTAARLFLFFLENLITSVVATSVGVHVFINLIDTWKLRALILIEYRCEGIIRGKVLIDLLHLLNFLDFDNTYERLRRVRG